jgi:hypothetical protein
MDSRSVAPDNPWVAQDLAYDDGGVVLQSRGDDCFTALQGIVVKPDTWHHLLLSFDISHKSHATSQNADSTYGDYGDTFVSHPLQLSNPCKIWAALDDVNYTGKNLRDQFLFNTPADFGINDFLSRDTYLAAASEIGGSSKGAGWNLEGSWIDALATSLKMDYTFAGEPLPTDSFGIPTGPDMQSQMKHVEMAEFQMWLGKTLDTSTQTNRRLFIAPKKNSDDEEVLKPVTPKTASKELGDPDILFHRSGNWKKGKNTADKANAHDFTPVGKIESYKPDPEIGK